MLSLAAPSFALNLEESLSTALNNNPDVKASLKKLDAAKYGVMQASGAFFPTIKLDASTGQIYSQPSVIQFTTPVGTQQVVMGFDNTIPIKSLGFTLSQPLYTGGKLLSGFDLAQKNYKISYYDYRKTALNVSYNATTAYFGAIKAKKMIELAEKSKSMSEEHLRQVQTMYDVGSATKADRLRGQVQLANSEVALTKAKNALIIADNSLSSVLGGSLEAAIETNPEDISSGISSLPDYSALLKTAYENRPEWQQFILSKDIAKDSIAISRADLLPSVALIGTYKSDYSQYPTFTTDLRSWTALISGSWSLFDVKVPAKIKEAEANLEASNSTEISLKNAIKLDVKNTFFELKSAAETVGSAKKALDLAEENNKVATARYALGAATNLEVIDAQVALTQAGIDYLEAQFDVKVSQAKINKAIGKEIF